MPTSENKSAMTQIQTKGCHHIVAMFDDIILAYGIGGMIIQMPVLLCQ